jgi:hypothetical protein
MGDFELGLYRVEGAAPLELGHRNVRRNIFVLSSKSHTVVAAFDDLFSIKCPSLTLMHAYLIFLGGVLIQHR